MESDHVHVKEVLDVLECTGTNVFANDFRVVERSMNVLEYDRTNE